MLSPQEADDGPWWKAHRICDLALQNYQKNPERFSARPAIPAAAGIVGVKHLPEEIATTKPGLTPLSLTTWRNLRDLFARIETRYESNARANSARAQVRCFSVRDMTIIQLSNVSHDDIETAVAAGEPHI